MFVRLSTATLTSLVFLRGTQGHMQMSWPYPLHSTFNPSTPESIKDYSMTSPLITDGSYPCKGFINNPAGSPAMDSVVTWKAGESINATMAGTAVHGGGSCQFSLSYDMGATWNVIHSYIGGCMIDTLEIPVTIPTSAPSGEALFAWTWFNEIGNREMYMNCAVVTIEDGGAGLDGPTPFVANAGVNECTTTAGVDVVFPDPGSSVYYGGKYASSKPTSPSGFTGSNCVGPGASSGGDTSPPSSSSSSSSRAAAASTSSSASHTTVEQSTTATPVSTSSAATISAPNAVVITSSSGSATVTAATATAASTGKSKNCKRSSRSRKRRGRRSPHERLVRRRVQDHVDY